MGLTEVEYPLFSEGKDLSQDSGEFRPPPPQKKKKPFQESGCPPPPQKKKKKERKNEKDTLIFNHTPITDQQK